MSIPYRVALLLFLGLTIGGCVRAGDTTSSVGTSDTSSNETAPAVPASAGSPAGSAASSAIPTSTPSDKVTVKIATNVFGATIQALDSETQEVVAELALESDKQAGELKVPAGKTYDIVTSCAGIRRLETKQQIGSAADYTLNFESHEINNIRKAATCLLNIPGGGFGSGFLFGDRQTIATAAHCVACPDVQELEIVFHPTEPHEVKFKGARLIYFDVKLDVAVLRLSEPVENTRPYFWRGENAKDGDEVHIVGNPGRSGEPDPIYARTGKVKDLRPDEFMLDIELQPGYSGGPISRGGTMEALGITSYKISASRDYKKVGQTFAKSISIAADGYTYWMGLSESARAEKISREADRYERRFGYLMANQASKALIVDTAIYAWSCVEVVEDYVLKRDIELNKLRNPSAARFNKTLKDFHNEYIKVHGPKQAEKTRERLSPRLRMQRHFGEVYKQALEDKYLPDEVKEHLKKAYEHYNNVKEAAEKVVDPSGRSKQGKSLEEFILWVIEEFEGTAFHAESVMEETEGRLE